jgi:hypothetical protein
MRVPGCLLRRESAPVPFGNKYLTGDDAFGLLLYGKFYILAACGRTLFDRINRIYKIFIYSDNPDHPV